tara:strand:- start:133 stop:819 length:687 start_codon:yes stop_codon:yes gene_type:complete
MKRISKRHKENKKSLNKKEPYSLAEAITVLKNTKKVKFDETLEIAIVLNKEKNKGENLAKGSSKLPHGTGKKIKIAVFASSEKIDEAKKAGADIVGNEDLIKKINEGKIEFDIAISTPEMMKDLAPIASKLGPLGIMPNPKTKTVTDNLTETIKDFKEGQIQFKSEKAGIVHAGIGKISFPNENLITNVKEFLDKVKKSKPDVIKGQFIKKIYLSLSMGPSLKISSVK